MYTVRPNLGEISVKLYTMHSEMIKDFVPEKAYTHVRYCVRADDLDTPINIPLMLINDLRVERLIGWVFMAQGPLGPYCAKQGNGIKCLKYV